MELRYLTTFCLFGLVLPACWTLATGWPGIAVLPGFGPAPTQNWGFEVFMKKKPNKILLNCAEIQLHSNANYEDSEIGKLMELIASRQKTIFSAISASIILG